MAGGFCDDQTTTKIEVEDNYSKVTDIGSNGTVRIKNDEATSNGKKVVIPDKGDKIAVSFDITRAGAYKLRVWLRSGNATDPTSYFNPKYSYRFDLTGIGNVSFKGNESSVQGPYGLSHWGFMEADVTFSSAGEKVLGIEADYVWQAVDYLEIIKDNRCLVCEGDITLSSQMEVDAFQCTEVKGNLTVGGDDITNLDGLKNLKSISNFLIINYCPSLIEIQKLPNLEFLSGLFVSYNENLTKIDPIASDAISYLSHIAISYNENLTKLDHLDFLKTACWFDIHHNPSLEYIGSLSNLTSICGALNIFENELLSEFGVDNLQNIGAHLSITNNNSLRYISLPSLKTIGKHPFSNVGLEIRNNPELTSLFNFQKLENVEGNVEVVNNTSLMDCCSLFPLLHRHDIGGTVNIYNNAAGCSEADILDCGGPFGSLIVRAKGSKAGSKFAHFTVSISGVIGDAVTTSEYKDYFFPLPYHPAAITGISVRFDNDGVINGEDRNLFIESITAGSYEVKANDLNCSYWPDRTPGQWYTYLGTMWWNGDLFFDLWRGNIFSSSRTSFSGNIYDMGSEGELDVNKMNIKIYPNPAQLEYNIALEGVIKSPAKLVMYDLYGRIVQQRNFSANELLKHQTIDVSHLTKGVYIVSLTTTEHANFMDKVVVE